MFQKYKDDNNYFNAIKKFNEDMNTKSFYDCLKTIGINDLKDLAHKSYDAFNYIISYSNSIYENIKILKKDKH